MAYSRASRFSCLLDLRHLHHHLLDLRKRLGLDDLPDLRQRHLSDTEAVPAHLDPVEDAPGPESESPEHVEGREVGGEPRGEVGIAEGEHVYFVHSFYVAPDESSISATFTEYGGFRFTSSVTRGNLFACQFHPEKSGAMGLKILENFGKLVAKISEG